MLSVLTRMDRSAVLASKIRSALAPCSLGAWPTPLTAHPELARAAGLTALWLKREDLAGGNKVRGLEFLMSGAAARSGLITDGGGRARACAGRARARLPVRAGGVPPARNGCEPACRGADDRDGAARDAGFESRDVSVDRVAHVARGASPGTRHAALDSGGRPRPARGRRPSAGHARAGVAARRAARRDRRPARHRRHRGRDRARRRVARLVDPRHRGARGATDRRQRVAHAAARANGCDTAAAGAGRVHRATLSDSARSRGCARRWIRLSVGRGRARAGVGQRARHRTRSDVRGEGFRRLPATNREHSTGGLLAHLPVVLIHGFLFDHLMWRHQVTAFASRRCIALDLRGAGTASAPDRPDDYSMRAYADDIIALLDSDHVDRAVFCGLAMGGYIAFELVRRFAGRIAALVLCNTKTAADSEEAKRARVALATKARQKGARAVASDMVT